MATLNSTTPSLIDIAATVGPDGKQMRIAEILNKENELTAEMVWQEGNLITGHRFAQASSLPTVAFRRLNEGVAISKGTNRPVDEASAMLEANSQVDRELAVLNPGGPEAYRAGQAGKFMESMKVKHAQTVFFGNSTLNPEEFTGFGPRYNDIGGVYDDQIIDAGGTGTDNRSIWLVGWEQGKVYGVYPKGTIAGLQHMDTTANKEAAEDGHAIGDVILDGNGNPYLGYRDHWSWKCGLAVEDPRYVIRICNIDVSLLIADISTGANIQRLMIEAVERLHGRTAKTAFYMPRRMSIMLRQQMVEKKNAFLSWEEIGGKRVAAFDGIPFRRIDELEADEARIT